MSKSMDWLTEFQLRKNSLISAIDSVTYGTDSIDDSIEELLRKLNFAELCLREEVYAEMAGHGFAHGKRFSLESVPPDTSCWWAVNDIQFSFPLWMFGPRKIKGERPMPSWHNGRPYVREKMWWEALIERLLHNAEYDVRTTPMGKAVVIQEMIAVDGGVADLDKYSITPFINALVHNNVLISDHPSYLEIKLVWSEGDGQTELANCYVQRL